MKRTRERKRLTCVGGATRRKILQQEYAKRQCRFLPDCVDHSDSCYAMDTDLLPDFLSSECTWRVYVSYGQPWKEEREKERKREGERYREGERESEGGREGDRGCSVSTPRPSPRLASRTPYHVVSYTVRRAERATGWTTFEQGCDPDRSGRTRGEVIAWKNVPRRRTTRSRIIFYEGIVSVLYIGSLTTRCSLVVAGVAPPCSLRPCVPYLHPLLPTSRPHLLFLIPFLCSFLLSLSLILR